MKRFACLLSVLVLAATCALADSYGTTWQIDDYLTFAVATHNPETAASADADSVPTYRLYEDETGTPILTGSMAKLDDAGTTGFYTERIQLTAANGFEASKSYHIVISAVVDANTAAVVHNFSLLALASADDVWAASTRTLTALDEDDTSLDLNATAIGSVVGVVGSLAGPVEVNVVSIREEIDDNSTQLAAILTDTGTTLPATLGSPAGTSMSADIAAIAAWDGSEFTNLPAVTLGNWPHGGAAASLTLGSYTNFQGDADAGAIADEVVDRMDANNVSLAAILEDTGTTIPATLGSPAGASISADIAAIEAGTAGMVLTDTIDGTVTVGDALEMVVAFLTGKVTIVDHGSTSTYTFYKRDGSTIKYQLTSADDDGARSTGGTIDP